MKGVKTKKYIGKATDGPGLAFSGVTVFTVSYSLITHHALLITASEGGT